MADQQSTKNEEIHASPSNPSSQLNRAEFLKRTGVLAAAAAVPAGVIEAARPLTSRASAAKVTINYMVAGGSPFSEVVQKMLPMFTAQQGIKVNVVTLPYEQTFSKAVIEARNRTGAYDVIQMNRPTLPAFIAPS